MIEWLLYIPGIILVVALIFSDEIFGEIMVRIDRFLGWDK